MRIILLLTLTLSLISCEDFFETTLELEVPPVESQVVLGSLLSNSETNHAVYLSETVSLNTDPLEGIISGGEVSLQYPGGETYDFVEDENINYYLADLPPLTSPGIYRIVASTPDGRTVSAEDSLPAKPVIISATYEENGGKDEFGSERSAIDIVIKDPAGVNYYKIGLCSQSTEQYRCLSLQSNDPSTVEAVYYRELLVTDAQFDGEDYRLRVLFYPFFDGDIESLTVSLAGISPDQYRYDRLLYSYEENEDNPFTSPVQLHTNIDGGQGLFAIENVTTYVIEL